MKQLARVVVPRREIEIVICDEGDDSAPWMPKKYVVVATTQPPDDGGKPTIKRAPFRTEDDLFEALDDLALNGVGEWKSIRKSLTAQFTESLRQARREEIHSSTDQVQRIIGIPINSLDTLRAKREA